MKPGPLAGSQGDHPLCKETRTHPQHRCPRRRESSRQMGNPGKVTRVCGLPPLPVTVLDWSN